MRILILIFSISGFGIFSGLEFFDFPQKGNSIENEVVLDHFIINIDDTTAIKNEEVCLGFVTRGFTNVLSLQFSINFDPGHLEYQHVVLEGMPGLSVGNFITTGSENGYLSFSWFAPGAQPVDLSDYTNLFSVCFTAIGEVGENSSVEITGSPTSVEVVKGDGPVNDYEWGNGVVLIRDNTCRSRDSLALVDLYLSTGGLFWNNSWNLNDPIDTWFGVTLDQNGCVTCLDLDGIDDCTYVVSPGGNNLTGELPSSLGSLQSLKQISLTDNKGIVGGIPPSLFSINSLENIYVDNCGLSLPIDTAVINMPNLSTFLLDYNFFTFEDIIPVVPFLETIDYDYEPQEKVFIDTTFLLDIGDDLILNLGFDQSIVDNGFDFYSNGTVKGRYFGSSPISWNNLYPEDAGTYYFTVSNFGAPELTLISHPFSIAFNPTCALSGLEVIQEPCNHSDDFYLTINFSNYYNTGTAFKLKINNLNFGNFDFSDLPLTIGPFNATGGEEFIIHVEDEYDSNCFLEESFFFEECYYECSFDVSVDAQNANCGLSNGNVAVEVNNGNGNYGILWEDGNENFVRNDLGPGKKTFVVSEDNCQEEQSLIVGFDDKFVEHDQITIGTAERENAVSFIETSDKGFLISGYTGIQSIFFPNTDNDIILTKVDSSLAIEWQKTLGGSDRDYGGLLLEVDGGYLFGNITASNDGDVSFNNGQLDIWIVKLNLQGEIIWEKTYGGNSDEFINFLMPTRSGNILMGGNTISIDGDIPEIKGSGDAWICLLSPDGQMIWSKTFGGSGSETVFDAIEKEDGNIILVGGSGSNDGDLSRNLGYNDFWIFQITPIGELVWSKTYGGSNTEYLSSITKSADNNFLVGGFSMSDDFDLPSNDGQRDMVLLKIDENGQLIKTAVFGGSKTDVLTNFFEVASGEIWVGGYSNSPDGDFPIAGTKEEIVLLKLNSNFEIIESEKITSDERIFLNEFDFSKDGKLLLLGNIYGAGKDIDQYYGEIDIWFGRWGIGPSPQVTINSDTSICKGEDLLLVASIQNCSGCTFEWENSSTNQIRSVSPVTTSSYFVTIMDQDGCIAADSTTISVLDNDTGLNEDYFTCVLPFNVTANPGSSYFWSNQDTTRTAIFDQPGDYDLIWVDSFGCLKKDSFQIIKTDALEVTIDTTICFGDTFYFGNQTYLNPSNLIDTLMSSQGCDSIIEINLYVKSPSEFEINSTICVGDSVVVNGTTYNYQSSSGIEYLTSIDGCDSIVTVNLNFFPEIISDTLFISICEGDSTFWEGDYYSQAGFYSRVFSSVNGCDSLKFLRLEQNQTVNQTLQVDICEGEVFTYQGQDYFMEGEYSIVLPSQFACDTMVTLNLSVQNTSPFFLQSDTVLIGPNSTPSLVGIFSNDIIPGDFFINVLASPENIVISQIGDSLVINEVSFQSFGSDLLLYEICLVDCQDVCQQSSLNFYFESDCLSITQSNLPNLITPDGNGANDVFDPIGLFVTYGCEVSMENSAIQIFTRNGEPVFFSEPYQPWDGLNRQGQSLPQGTYYYVLKIQSSNGEQILKGPINLLRQ